MAKRDREDGYIAQVPVFIPVDKKNVENQIAVLQALMQAGRGGGLDEIMALPGIRLHLNPGKDILSRWTSVPVAPDQA